MNIGFTGTRNGLSVEQAKSLRFLLLAWMVRPRRQPERRKLNVFQHGAAIGADAHAATIAKELGLRIIARPGMDKNGDSPDRDAASVALSDLVFDSKTYFARNRDIVDSCDLLIACPPCWPLPDSGGTVYTLNYARGKIPVLVVCPDGSIRPMPW